LWLVWVLALDCDELIAVLVGGWWCRFDATTSNCILIFTTSSLNVRIMSISRIEKQRHNMNWLYVSGKWRRLQVHTPSSFLTIQSATLCAFREELRQAWACWLVGKSFGFECRMRTGNHE
jgi:hypothetical protein